MTAEKPENRAPVEDIETDPLWADYRGLALEHDLAVLLTESDAVVDTRDD